MKVKVTQKAKTGFVLAFALLGAMAIAAAAQDGCGGFSWPIETEIAWMTAPDSEAVETGVKVPALAAKAIALKLKPSKEVTPPVKSGMKKQAIGPDSFSGWFEIASLPKSGGYQVSTSAEGWIGVVQNGEAAISQPFAGERDCKAAG